MDLASACKTWSLHGAVVCEGYPDSRWDARVQSQRHRASFPMNSMWKCQNILLCRTSSSVTEFKTRRLIRVVDLKQQSPNDYRTSSPGLYLSTGTAFTRSLNREAAAQTMPRLVCRAFGNDAKTVKVEAGNQRFGAAWGKGDVVFRQFLAMFAAGAVLGPLLDGRHSYHNVLHYTSPTVKSVLGYPLETCWWVPLLFGVAAIILGLGHPLLDRWQPLIGSSESQKPEDSTEEESHLPSIFQSDPIGGRDPSWPFVLAGIATFATQYDLSGILTESNYDPVTVNSLLFATAVIQWAVFDRTRGGLFLAALTAVAGPVLEIVLIYGGLYHYTSPDIFGIPLWIPWVYWCGSPAVGNLGRRVRRTLEQKLES